MEPVPEATQCSVAGPASVRLAFRDGWTGVLDLGPALRGPVFGALKAPAKFREVTGRDGTLVWPNGEDICPSVLRYWCELGRVCSQAEVDAHFAAPARPPAGMVTEATARYRANRKR
ncbi:DUF2442 domain-containing protein [bacterium]|nr:DUF2442 domain-containing protein [bacterium]